MHLVNRDRCVYDWHDKYERHWLGFNSEPKTGSGIKAGNLSNGNFTPADYKLLANSQPANFSVLGSIYVETAAGTHSNKVSECKWIISLAQTDPQWIGLIAGIPIENGAEETENFLDELRDPITKLLPTLLKGSRSLFWNFREFDAAPGKVFMEFLDKTCQSAKFLAGLQVLKREGLIFEFAGSPGILEPALEVVRANPGMNFVIEHCGFAFGGAHGFEYETWKTDIGKIAENRNVWVKMADMEEWKCDVSTVRRVLKDTLNAFGSSRCLAETNWMISCAHGLDFWRPIELLKEEMEGLGWTQENQNKVFALNAIELYQLDS